MAPIICEQTTTFCERRRFFFRWARSSFHSDTGLPLGPHNRRYSLCYTFYPSLSLPNKVHISCTWMTTCSSLGAKADPTSVPSYPSRSILMLKGRRPRSPSRPQQNRRPCTSPHIEQAQSDTKRTRISLVFCLATLHFAPKTSVKWLTIVLDGKLSPLAQASSRAPVTASVVGLFKRLSNTKANGFPSNLDLPSSTWQWCLH